MASQLLPRSILFGQTPLRLKPQLSPDGLRIAYISSESGALNIWVAPVAGGRGTPVTRDTSGVREFTWLFDSRHLMYAQDRGGDEGAHLYVVDSYGGETRDVTPFQHVQARLVARAVDSPLTLVGLNLRHSGLHDLYQLDLATGTITHVHENPGFVRWLANSRLEVCGGVAARPDGGAAVCAGPDQQWRPVYEIGSADSLGTSPQGLSGSGDEVLMISCVDADVSRLVSVRLRDGHVTVLYEDPTYDTRGVIASPLTGRPQIAVVQRERTDLEILDPAVADDVRRLREVDSGELGIASRDRRDETWLVRYSRDDAPTTFWRYDRRRRDTDFLFTHEPALEGRPLARTEPWTLRARDGLELHGYITFPPGTTRRGLPTVLRVHSGPWSRTTWGYDAERQWLANRGYLVVEVNFRGSTGYGKAFLHAGIREWGRRMQDDLLDAVDRVVERGWTDPRRIGIYGASYGGYAALAGVAFTPDVFRCAIALNAPTDLRRFLAGRSWGQFASRLISWVGDPATDEDDLWSRSPMSRADAVRAPVLIAQGANDPRVPCGPTREFVAALRRNCVPHEYIEFPDEGHDLVNVENRLRFYRQAERFLAEQLGGRVEDATRSVILSSPSLTEETTHAVTVE